MNVQNKISSRKIALMIVLLAGIPSLSARGTESNANSHRRYVLLDQGAGLSEIESEVQNGAGAQEGEKVERRLHHFQALSAQL